MTTGMKLSFFGFKMIAAFIYYFRRNFLVLAFTVLFKPGADAQKSILEEKIIELAIPAVSIRI
jgi:hypothetical protein